MCLTDSTVALWWIKNTDTVYKQFVQERVKEIRRNVGTDCWRHISGKENPADLPSRGCYCNEFNAISFLSGPEWLCQEEVSWPIKDLKKCNMPDSEMKKVAKSAISLHASKIAKIDDIGLDKVIDASNFSSYDKLLKVTSWVFRFGQNCKKGEGERVMGEISAAEIFASEILWIKNLQKNSLQNLSNFDKTSQSLGLFEDEMGVLRCGGRLKNSLLPPDTMHPIMLPPEHHITRLIINKAHLEVYHNGVQETLVQLRAKFWISKGRQVVKKQLKNCNVCRKLEGMAYGAPSLSQLPKHRVEGNRAFSAIGIDFCGPLFLKTPRGEGENKSYIALITCCSSRMVHLELCSSLDTAALLGCLKRFFARRGTPSLIISDNAKTFKASTLKSFIASRGISWHYNLAKAPWWGGAF